MSKSGLKAIPSKEKALACEAMLGVRGDLWESNYLDAALIVAEELTAVTIVPLHDFLLLPFQIGVCGGVALAGQRRPG